MRCRMLYLSAVTWLRTYYEGYYPSPIQHTREAVGESRDRLQLGRQERGAWNLPTQRDWVIFHLSQTAYGG
jgi:hypothetical protein